MMNTLPSAIYQIRRSKSIVEHLAKRGHNPVKNMAGGKLQYLCPFPDHKETFPSFVVYTEAEYENFHCFGCQRSFDIIHLVAGLDGISYAEAAEKLGADLDMNPVDGARVEGDRIAHDYNASWATQDVVVIESIGDIGYYSKTYLDGVQNDPLECEIVDKMLAVLDKDIKESNFDGILETIKNLPDILRERRTIFEDKKAQALYRQYKVENK